MIFFLGSLHCSCHVFVSDSVHFQKPRDPNEVVLLWAAMKLVVHVHFQGATTIPRGSLIVGGCNEVVLP